MEKKFEVLPPVMPNFVVIKKPVGVRQDGFQPNNGFPVKDFTRKEAEEYAELMKQTFIKHWESMQNKL